MAEFILWFVTCLIWAWFQRRERKKWQGKLAESRAEVSTYLIALEDASNRITGTLENVNSAHTQLLEAQNRIRELTMENRTLSAIVDGLASLTAENSVGGEHLVRAFGPPRGSITAEARESRDYTSGLEQLIAANTAKQVSEMPAHVLPKRDGRRKIKI